MSGWIWGLGYALCGAVTAAWYLRRVGRSDAWMRQLEAELSSLPPWMPAPGVMAVVAIIVGWPIPVIQYTVSGRAFRNDPPEERR